MTKLEQKQKAQDDDLLAKCTAGIEAVLSDPLVAAAEKLLDETAAELFRMSSTEPLFYVRQQVLRATGSVASNLAEGIGQGNRLNMRRLFLIARGSAYESVIWFRALAKESLTDTAIELCRGIDAAIIAMTKVRTEAEIAADLAAAEPRT